MTTTTTPRSLTIEQVDEIVQAGTHTILDVNSAARYAQGHIPDAVNVDRDDVGASLPPAKETPLVFYCGSVTCQAAPNAAKHAIELGYADVSVLPAGIAGWEEAGRATVPA